MVPLHKAYTALVMQFPAVAVSIVAAVAGFLGAAIPGVSLERVAAGATAVEDGMIWAGVAGGFAALASGLIALTLLRRADGGRHARIRGALATGVAAAVAPPLGWLGAVLGTSLGGGVSIDLVFEQSTQHLTALSPTALGAVLMALAIGISAAGRTR